MAIRGSITKAMAVTPFETLTGRVVRLLEYSFIIPTTDIMQTVTEQWVKELA